jgi:hypothetical protein
LFSPSSPDARYYKAPPHKLSRLPLPQVEGNFAGLFTYRFQVSGYRFQVGVTAWLPIAGASEESMTRFSRHFGGVQRAAATTKN